MTVELLAEADPSLAGTGPPDSTGVRAVASPLELLVTSSEQAGFPHLPCVEWVREEAESLRPQPLALGKMAPLLVGCDGCAAVIEGVDTLREEVEEMLLLSWF